MAQLTGATMSWKAAATARFSFTQMMNAADPSKLGLIAPQQSISWTYGELEDKARRLAQGLREHGFKKNSIAISDVPNIAENVLLQAALSHIGAAIATPPKDAAALAALNEVGNVLGTVSATIAQPLPPGAPALRLPPVVLDFDGSSGGGFVAFDELLGSRPHAGATRASEESLLGVYGTAALTHEAALEMATAAAEKLGTTADDRVCCSVTLMHPFGIGSAVTSAVLSGGAVVLPAVGGIKGCGDPKQRAQVTLEVLAATRATQIFGDTHTLRAMPPPSPDAEPLALRTGVIKIGSGATYLDGVREVPAGAKAPALPLEYAGVALLAMGPAPAGTQTQRKEEPNIVPRFRARG